MSDEFVKYYMGRELEMLPEEIVEKTKDKYLQAYRMLTGKEL